MTDMAGLLDADAGDMAGDRRNAGASPVSPGADAGVPVERLLRWAVRDQRADLVEGAAAGRVGPAGWAGSMTGKLEARLRLGADVDGAGSAAMAAPSCDPDAATVYRVACGVANTRLVLEHARLGTRPDWWPNPDPRLVPAYRQDGRVMTFSFREVGRKAGKGRPKSAPAVCLLRQQDPPEMCARLRERWVAWWTGLAAVKNRLREVGLARYAVADTLPPVAPWSDAGELARAWAAGERGGYHCSVALVQDPQDFA